MAFNMQQLNFMVRMTDHVSKPAHSMMTKMDSVSNSIQSSFTKIGVGGAGLFATGYAMDRLIAPARELDRALGEVESLNMDNAAQVLTGLTQKSIEFTTTYGGNAAEFVRSSYDIQSAISGLVGNELGTFTQASAILAKGTKADVGVITNYMGTMFSIFENEANAIGKEAWVEKMAGQTAAAVQIFKTTGQGMSDAFGRLGKDATTRGIAMSEQMAVLGKLQATMSGSEAGTKYVSFLSNIGKAQEELGLKFTDSQGKMLPMINILEKINGTFGALDEVAELDILKKAFGTEEAAKLVTLLAGDVSGLNSAIGNLEKQQGMQTAIKMAKKMADPFEIMSAKMSALQITLGTALMPTVLDFLDVMGEGAASILRWSNLFPNLTKWVGVGTLAVFGIIAGLSVLTMVAGGAAIVGTGLGLVFSGLAAVFSWAGLSVLLFYGPILLLGALLVAAVVYWDDWTGAVVNAGKELISWASNTEFVQYALKSWDKLTQWWGDFKTYLNNLNPLESIANGAEWVMGKFGFGGEAPQGAQPIAVPRAIGTGVVRQEGGGVIQRFNTSNNNTDNRSSVEKIVINNFGAAMSGAELNDELLFAAG